MDLEYITEITRDLARVEGKVDGVLAQLTKMNGSVLEHSKQIRQLELYHAETQGVVKNHEWNLKLGLAIISVINIGFAVWSKLS